MDYLRYKSGIDLKTYPCRKCENEMSELDEGCSLCGELVGDPEDSIDEKEEYEEKRYHASTSNETS